MSLVPLLRGEDVSWRTDFLFEHRFDHPEIPKSFGVRGERWVYARYDDQDPAYEQLFDLEQDPGELRNLAECLTIFAAWRAISLDDLPEALLQRSPDWLLNVGAVPAAFYRREPGKAAATLLDLQQIERLTIEQALRQFDGNRSAAAGALGISRRTLQRKLKEYQMANQHQPGEDAGKDETEAPLMSPS